MLKRGFLVFIYSIKPFSVYYEYFWQSSYLRRPKWENWYILIEGYRLISLLVHQPPSWCLVTQRFISIFLHKHPHKYPNNQSFLIHTHTISIHTYRYVLCDCTIAIQSFFIHLVLKEVEASGEEITGHRRTYATFLSFSLTTAFAGERERARASIRKVASFFASGFDFLTTRG